jgi:bromodomain-containing protein 7/9
MSYLRLGEDGGVRLRIITPMKRPEDGCEPVLNLEQICGQLEDGLDVIPSDIDEDEYREQMQVNPVSYVEPPPFGSHLPIKDSTFANLSKEDSEMLLEIYGSETGFEYAESLQCFAGGTNYCGRMVDSLLNLLTDGEHKKVSEDEVQKQLDEIDHLLNKLKQVQERRLSSSPSPIEPDEEETKLADEVIQKMTKLIKDKAKPGEICDSSAIFKALGVDLIN